MLTTVLTGAMALALMADPQSAPVTLAADPALHGTLLTPDAPRAVAVILPGSGPTNRDGDNVANGTPLEVRAATYRLLAEALAERGVATIRIDKRGVGESRVPDSDERMVRFDDYASDARAWAADAAARTGLPCAWLIGHSEGALVALAATRDDDVPICGLVLLAGAGRPAQTVIAEQLAGLPEPMKTQALDALAELAAGRETDGVPGLESLFRPSVQPYLISWFALDPAALIAAYDGPVLIGRGSTDLQVADADLQALAEAQPAAAVVRFEGVNHVLKTAPSDRSGNLAAYSNPDLPLADGVAEVVARFILAEDRATVAVR